MKTQHNQIKKSILKKKRTACPVAPDVWVGVALGHVLGHRGDIYGGVTFIKHSGSLGGCGQHPLLWYGPQCHTYWATSSNDQVPFEVLSPASGGHPLTHRNSQKIKNKKNLKKIAKMNRAGMGEGTDRGIRARMGEHRLSHLPTSHFSGNILTPN